MELNQIIHGDSIKILRELDDSSFDLCVTDPPYKLTSGGCTSNLKPGYKGRIVFNTTNHKMQSSGEFFEIPPFYIWMHEVFRVLRNKTHFYCMTNQKNLKNIILDGEKVGFKVLNILVWDKGMHTPLGYYMQNVEFIILFRRVLK